MAEIQEKNLQELTEESMGERLAKEKQAVQNKKKELANPQNLAKLLQGNQGDPNLGPQNEDGSFNYINPETGLYQRKKPQISPINQLDRAAGSDVYTGKEGEEHKREDFDPYKERQEKKDLSGKTPRFRNDKKSFLKTKGEQLGAKTAGKAIGAIALQGGPVSAGLIYGLAILNDFPDLASPVIESLTLGTGVIVDFLFDLVVFLGFRYFLREHINVPGIRVILYSSAFLELLPIPVFSPDILPFWTICAWLALRKIKQEKEIEEHTGMSQAQAADLRQLELERKYAYYNQLNS